MEMWSSWQDSNLRAPGS